MNDDTALWNELNGIFLADEETDAAVVAYQSGDMMELGRIVMTHINRQISSRAERLAAYDRRIAEGDRSGLRYEITNAGKEAAGLQGGVL